MQLGIINRNTDRGVLDQTGMAVGHRTLHLPLPESEGASAPGPMTSSYHGRGRRDTALTCSYPVIEGPSWIPEAARIRICPHASPHEHTQSVPRGSAG